MGIFGALTTAISGLQAQSFALEHISNNIANSQTTAFKRVETVFSEVVAESDPQQLSGGVVLANSRATNDVQGDIQSSDVDTHMAINGDGYFIVEQRSGTADGLPVFQGVDQYSRRGDFETDQSGFLVNGAGYFLKGIPIDAATGNPIGNQPDVIQITRDFLPAQATTQITYRANLAQLPATAAYDPLVPNSELIDPTDFTTDPTTAGTGTVRADEADVFLDQSLAGGAITAFDPGGNPVNIQMRWSKTDSVANGGTDTWNLFYLADSTATGATTQWQNVGQDYIFAANGQPTPPLPSVSVPTLTVNGINLGTIQLDHGVSGLSQFADVNGNVTVTDINQNGYQSGELSSISVSDEGRIVGVYTNGETLDIAEVTLATFNADSQLARLDGGAFAATADSGVAILDNAGAVIARSLEGSNSDIANEFSKLIVTQQAYAAGTRIVSTADEMLQEALNMVR